MTSLLKAKKHILDLLKENQSLCFEKIHLDLSKREGLLKREVNEAVWQLLEEGQIKHNRQREVELI